MNIHELKDWRDSALRSIDREIDCLEEKLKRLYDHKRLLEAVDKLTDVLEAKPTEIHNYFEGEIDNLTIS